MSNIFVTIPDKLFPITPNLYKLPCFEVRPAELGFKGFPEAEAGRWCAIQGSKVKVNSLGSDNRGQEESYRGGFIAEGLNDLLLPHSVRSPLMTIT
jgi:hypothetical protein